MSKMTVEEIEKALPQFTGTENYYRSNCFGKAVHTDGVHFLAESAECHWLIDVVESYQLYPRMKAESFQVWTLKLNKTGNGAVVTCTDGNYAKLASQRIPYTDFPLKEIKLFRCDNVLMLPSEY